MVEKEAKGRGGEERSEFPVLITCEDLAHWQPATPCVRTIVHVSMFDLYISDDFVLSMWSVCISIKDGSFPSESRSGPWQLLPLLWRCGHNTTPKNADIFKQSSNITIC
jgi:hypothetical protein